MRPETVIPEKTPDPQVLDLAESLGHIVVTHDVSTMAPCAIRLSSHQAEQKNSPTEQRWENRECN
jgi:hypothetical protein